MTEQELKAHADAQAAEAAKVAAQVKTEQVAKDAELAKGPSGLDSIKAEDLKSLYSKSPQMFKDAGIVQAEPVLKPVELPQSAAPVAYEGIEIKFEKDVVVPKEVLDKYFVHAKANGLTPKQVQAEIDFQLERAREFTAAQPKVKTSQELQLEQDGLNVAALKADPVFGKAYEANMELARRAAAKFGDAELLERLRTSDPVLVRHFHKLGLADAEDGTRRGQSRNGNESDEADPAKAQEAYMRRRYSRSPQMFPDNPKQD